MINPDGIPQYEGEPGQLTAQAQALASAGTSFASTGRDVNGAWQGLGGPYSAPEAGQLLTAMQPVADRSRVVGDETARVSAALATFADTMAPLKLRLQQLKAEAASFVASVAGDDDWTDDGDKVDHNNAMLTEVDRLVAEWQAAERSCANAIEAAFGSSFRYVADNGDGTTDIHEYGYSQKAYDDALGQDGGKLPWGSRETEDPGILGNIGGFFKGVFVDGVWGDIKGLGTLIGVNGWSAAGQAWTNLGVLGTMLAPGGTLAGMAWPALGRRQQAVSSGLFGSMFATDMWGKNPGRALGAVTWNIGSLFLGGEGAVGKAGKLGRLGELGDVGELGAKAGRISVGSLLDRVGEGSADAGRIEAHLDDLAKEVDVPTRGDVHLDVPDPERVPTIHEPAVHEPAAHVTAPAEHPTPGHPSTGDGGTPPGHPQPPAGSGGNHPPPLGPAHQPFENPHPVFSDGVHPVSADRPPIDVHDLSPRDRGMLGEDLTRADLERQGYTVLVEQRHVLLPGSDTSYFVPDFIARAPDGTVVAVESKFGPGADFTPGQLTGYGHMGSDGGFTMRSTEMKALMQRAGVDRVDEVVVYRWNTEIVPDDGLLADAGWGSSP